MAFEKVIENLKNNNMEALYFESSKDVVEDLKSTLKKGATITSGGSVSLVESGVMELLTNGDYNYLDRNNPNLSSEEKQNVFKTTVGGDYYFCSSNAVTEGGDLCNVDGFANRITALTFGPKKVFLVVGKNKIVKSIDEGFLRIKKTVAPKNCVRLGLDNPCTKLGHCVSLLKSENPSLTSGCECATRICRNYIVTSKQGIKDRITVLLVNEDLGY